jgi:hypothetical protein
MSLTNYELWTFHDVLNHVLGAVVGDDASKRNERQARQAIFEAYQELATVRDWRYFYRRMKITTSASQSSSTITYDHTGGAHERMVTLAAGTWPTDAEKFEIQIDSVRYEVERRVSDTILTLSERANPGSDVDAGTSYILLRDTYELPDDFVGMWQLVDVVAPLRLTAVSWPSDVMLDQRINKATAMPTYYTVGRTHKFAGAQAVIFSPAPGSARTYDAIIKVRPLPLQVYDDNEGTVSLANGATTVNGAETAFATKHVGAVIRFSANAVNPPTSQIGQIRDDIYNPFVLQRVIKRITSATVLEVEQASDYGSDLAAINYRISSRIDIEAGAMLTYFLRLCEAKFAPADRKGVAEREALAKLAFQNAAWADQRMRDDPGSPFLPHSLADIASSVDPTEVA